MTLLKLMKSVLIDNQNKNSMNSKGFFYRITLTAFLLSLSVVAGAQGGAIVGNIVKGVVNSTKAAQKSSDAALEALRRTGALQPTITAPALPTSSIELIRSQIVEIPTFDTLYFRKPLQTEDGVYFGIYLDCLALEDEAEWNDKITILCRRLAVLDNSKSREQWREHVDSGRSRKIRFLILLPKLPEQFLAYLVGSEEEHFGREEGLLVLRLDEEP